MLMALTLVLPLAAAAVFAFAGALGPQRAHRLRRAAALASPLAVLPAVGLTLFPHQPVLEAPWLLFGTEFDMDSIGRSLTLIAALLYGASLMAVNWVRTRHAEPGPSALSAFLLVCFTGNIGTYLAADASSFYLSFTVMSFSAAGLVIHYRHQAARRATRIYLVLSVLSETAILGGLVLTVAAGGYLLADAPDAVAASPHTGLIVTLLLIGFGVKAGTVPLHVWLPLAHPAAPPAASAVLSGAMVKAGLIGWLRFVPSQDDGGGAVLAAAGTTLLVLALIGAFASAAVGVLQQDPKVVLAYSTISQMGFITALAAAGMMDPELAPGAAAAAVLYAVHHGLAKGALFLGVPVVKHFGRGWAGVLVVIGMVAAGLALAGAPLTSGAYAKYVSKEAVGGITVLGVGLEHLLPLVATGSILLLMRLGFVLFHTETQAPRRPDGELVSFLGIVAVAMVVPWLLGQHWIPEAGGFSLTASSLWDASWPILLGLGLGAAVWRLAATDLLPGWLRPAGDAVQPGDLIVAQESLAVGGSRAGVQLADRTHRVFGGWGERFSSAAAAAAALTRRAVWAGERGLGDWHRSGAAVLTLLVGAVVVLAWGWLL